MTCRTGQRRESRTARQRYPGPKIKRRSENCTYETVKRDVLEDYVYATQAWKWDHDKAQLWIARGYGIPWDRITRWPIQEDAEGMTWL